MQILYCNKLKTTYTVLRDIEERRAGGTRQETQEQCAEKESESSLARSLATRNGEVAQSKT